MPPDTTAPVYAASPPTRAATLHGGLWAMLGASGRYLLAGITTLALTRLLSPADFGLVAIAALAQLLIEHILPIGFQDALIQRADLTPRVLDSAFWSVTAITLVAAASLIALAAPLAAWFGQPQLAPLLVGMAFAALLRAFSTVPRALLHRHMDFRTLALVRIAGLLVAGIGAVLLAAAGAGAWSLVAHVALVNAITLGLIARRAGYRPALNVSPAALRDLWRFAPSVAIFAALSASITKLDDQIVGFYLGPDALGYYALAYAFMAWPVYDVLGGIAVVLYPVFSRLQTDRARLQAAYLESLTLATLFAFPVLALLAISAPVLLPWLLGSRWAPAALPAQILAVGGLRAATGMLNGPVYRALNRPHLHTLLELASVPCYLTAFVVGVRHGIAGVALLIVLTGFLLQPLSWLLLFGTTGLSLRRWLGALVPAATGTLLLALAAAPVLHYTEQTRISTDARLVITGTAGAGVYVLWLGLIRPLALKRLLSELKRLC